MGATPSALRDPDTVSWVRSALRNLHDDSALSQHPLGDSRAVGIRVEAGAARAQALRDVLLAAVGARKPAEDVDPNDGAWQEFHILQRQFVQRRKRDVVASELGLAHSAYHVHQSRALRAVAQWLAQTEAFLRAHATDESGGADPSLSAPTTLGRAANAAAAIDEYSVARLRFTHLEFALTKGAYGLAAAMARQHLDTARRLFSGELKGRYLARLGEALSKLGEFEASGLAWEEGLAYSRMAGQYSVTALILLLQGGLAAQLRDWERARELLAEGGGIADGLPDRHLRVLHVIGACNLLAGTGEAHKALSALDDAMADTRLTERADDLALLLDISGWLKAITRDLAGAHRAFERGLGLAQAQAMLGLEGDCTFGLARLAHLRGDAHGAHEMGRRSLDLYVATGHWFADRVRRWLDKIGRSAQSAQSGRSPDEKRTKTEPFP